MKKLLLIPGVAAIALLWTPVVHAQAVVRETTTTTTAAAPMEVAGTITEWSPDTVIVRENGVAAPVRFAFGDRVEYVDAAGRPVAREVITQGAPVTLRYTRVGDRMLVNRVIVQRTATAPVATTTETTTTRTTTISGHAAKEMDKLREKIAHDEKELSEHPDRDSLREKLAGERAQLDQMQRDLR
jgi:hypothetical protein